MSFKKTGDTLEVTNVYCPCGGIIDLKTKKCLNCGKEQQPNEVSETKKEN